MSCDFPYRSQPRPSPLHHLSIALRLLNSLCQPDGHMLSVIKAHRGNSYHRHTHAATIRSVWLQGCDPASQPTNQDSATRLLIKMLLPFKSPPRKRNKLYNQHWCNLGCFILLPTISAVLYQLVKSQHWDAKTHSIRFNYCQISLTPTSLLTTSSQCSRITEAFRFTFSLLSIVATDSTFVQKYI